MFEKSRTMNHLEDQAEETVQLSSQDMLVMKLEKLCKDFLFEVLRTGSNSITMKTLKIDDLAQLANYKEAG